MSLDLEHREIFDISPTISSETPVYPGDVSFKRDVSMDFSKGDHLALSSITTTVHIGAHTDAPNHYSDKGEGIDQRDLKYYLGEAQVLDFSDFKNSLIKHDDVKSINISSKRLLFKTTSFNHKGPWSNEFTSFSPCLIEYLSNLGVFTIGIDTPSVDPATSKGLDCHNMILKKNMAILEGINLDDVKEGTYSLIALPLKLKDADASPVRAILIK